MAAHTHSYEPLDVELHEVEHPKYADADRLNPEPNKAPSFISSLTDFHHVDDDERSLLSRRRDSAPKQPLDNVLDADGALSRSPRAQRHRFKSWKVGVLAAGTMTTAVLLVNSVLTIWASVKYGSEDGIGTVYEGSCHMVSAWSFWLHILINGLSSVLLSASNYTMQCVTAPTRTECDRAHARGDWLDIGIPSVRNLFKIRWQRKVMWALLALSSTPIHLLYNSAVFKTLDDNTYDRLLVGPKFLDADYSVNGSAYYIVDLHKSYVSDPASFKNISSKTCIETYATFYLSGHGDVLLITDDTITDIEPSTPIGTDVDLPDSAFNAPPFKW